MNSSHKSDDGVFFNQNPLILHPADPRKSQESNLVLENVSQSLHHPNGDLKASIVSPENPLKQFMNQDFDNHELSLGISPQIQMSTQFKFPGLTLQKPGESHNFEDSIDLKQTDSPPMKQLPMLQENVILRSIDLTNNNNIMNTLNSGKLKESGILQSQNMKNSMQSPQLEALENYLEKVEEKKDDITHSRPGSGDPLFDKTSPDKASKKSKSPLKKWKQKLEEERLALIESMMKEEEEKKENDEEFMINLEEIKGYEKKIQEEINNGTLKPAKTFEKENNIVSYKRVYHNLFLFNNFLKNLYRRYLLINLSHLIKRFIIEYFVISYR